MLILSILQDSIAVFLGFHAWMNIKWKRAMKNIVR